MGTKKGITAIQMDLKNDGLTMEIIKNALEMCIRDSGQVIDSALAVLFPGPGSYTGQDCGELQCHGSPVVLDADVYKRQG